MRTGASGWAVALASVILVLSFGVGAQTLTPMDFARHSAINEVSLSPKGDYVALSIPADNGLETQLKIVKVDGSAPVQVLRFGSQQHVGDVIWTADEQLVLARAKTLPLRPRPESYGQLFSSDITGKHQHTLFGYFLDQETRRGRRKDEGFARVVRVLDSEPGVVLVSYQCWNCGEKPDTVIFKVNSMTGDRSEVERSPGDASFTFDHAGHARIRITADDNDEQAIAYRQTARSDWQPMPRELVGHAMRFGNFSADDKTLYAAISDKGEPAQLYRVDLASGKRTKVAGRTDAEVAGYEIGGRDGAPIAVVFDGGKPELEYIDSSSEWSGLLAGLMSAFPGQLVSFESFSRDNDKVLFSARSDRQAANYYLYTRSSKKMMLVAESRPWLKPDQLAPMHPIQFEARDGTRLNAFYTAKDDSMRPLVVIPHGGPHGIYDTWGYDSDAQFFASRGYGVLQVNFRGSGGRGDDFQHAGYLQWGGLIQDDIADGVRYVTGKGYADAKRVCTYGASFGGYAALMQPIRNPGMYECAVGYVGVYDLMVMKKTGDITRTQDGRRYLDRVLGTDDAALIANSPARNVEKIGVPVFLAQGSIDQRVPMDQFNALRKAFTANGQKIETMVAGGEGHGFYKPENQAELYERAADFMVASMASKSVASSASHAGDNEQRRP